MASPLKRINQQNEKTWSKLHQRLATMRFNHSEVMDEQVMDFFKHKAKSVGSSVGLLFPTVLTTTCFLISSKQVKIKLSATHEQPLNIFMVLVGPPSVAKSPAMKEGVFAPLEDILDNYAKVLVSNTTSSGLTKMLHKEKECYVCSPEIFDILNKLLKNDEENASGDAQLLCKLFTGERCSYHFSTETVREIGPDTPFCIFGATQVSNAARLLSRMDNGHGLIDRFLFSIPPGFRPLPEEQEESLHALNNLHIRGIAQIYEKVLNLHPVENTSVYYLDEDAERMLKDMTHEHIVEINQALTDGEVTPHTKKCDIIPRIAVAMHILEAVTKALLQDREIESVQRCITSNTLQKAIEYVNHLEEQKETFLTVSDPFHSL